jgi:hypothetical protein
MCLPLCYTSVCLVLISTTRAFGALRTTSLGRFATTSSTTRVLLLRVKVRLAVFIILFFLTSSEAGFISGDPIAFVLNLSEKLAEFAPRLTLDFIHEVSAAMTSMDKASISTRISCVQYMSPWIQNLSHFANATHPLYERSGARLRDCIRTLSDLSVAYPDVRSFF